MQLLKTEPDPSACTGGIIKVGDKTYKVVELASHEMKNSAGATWDAGTAGKQC
jgi:methyl-galactoside transport system substrate-binding protein